jgi:3-dehydroquinate dehydratase-2
MFDVEWLEGKFEFGAWNLGFEIFIILFPELTKFVLKSLQMKIIIINGPNLNLLGLREPGVYGTESFDTYLEFLKKKYPEIEFVYYQSNIEGEIINKLHETGFIYDGIILNAGGYTHTSVAIGDAVKAIKTPVVEVHISNIHAREEFRCISMISAGVKGIITGFGLDSYRLAVESFLK